ncbi:MAG: ABC transporter ATP-binding protein [Nitrospinae bacterium]|nr:ABC transporter ATP-binding protein [Nitrospinota bacterium]
MENALQVENLTKSYDGHNAVNGISFAIGEGEFVGLLGPNGAGKTTTIKTLTGLVKPTGGSFRYFGSDFIERHHEAKRFIGVVPQHNNLDRDLTARENLQMHAILYGIPKNARAAKIGEALEFAGLAEQRDKQVKTFSGGMMRRLVIVRALLHGPRILFLDEPTSGLDPQMRRNLWDFIVKINQAKRMAILMTTHYIEEAERLCRRVLFINSGLIVAEGEPQALKREVGHYALEIFREDGIDEQFFMTKEAALDAIRGQHHPCKVREATLEDVFLKLTGRRINV